MKSLPSRAFANAEDISDLSSGELGREAQVNQFLLLWGQMVQCLAKPGQAFIP